jgi:hypothetical protein
MNVFHKKENISPRSAHIHCDKTHSFIPTSYNHAGEKITQQHASNSAPIITKTYFLKCNGAVGTPQELASAERHWTSTGT